MKRVSPMLSIGAVSVLTLGLCIVIGFDLFPPLRGPQLPNSFEWAWQPISPPDLVLWKLVLPLGVMALVGVWAFYTRHIQQLNHVHIFALVILALAFRLSVQETGLQGNSIVARVMNPAYFGYFEPATRIDDFYEFLSTYAEEQHTLSYRQTTHPPGNTVFYWSIIQLFRNSPAVTNWLEPWLAPRIAQWPSDLNSYSVAEVLAGLAAALLVPGLSALSIWPLYRTATFLFNFDTARLTILLFPFIPALTLFTPIVDDLYTFEAALALWLVTSGYHTGSPWRFWLAGVITGVAFFQSLSTIPMIVALGLAILAYQIVTWQSSGLRGLFRGVAFTLGVPVLWIFIWAFFGLNPIQVIINCLTNYEARMRSYWLSLIYNPWDILLFVGVPLAIHFLLAVYRLIVRFLQRQPLTLADSILMGCLGAMLVLIVGGSLRGETARTLLFVCPILTLFAAHDISHGVRPSYYPVLLIGLLSIQTIVFQSTLAVYH